MTRPTDFTSLIALHGASLLRLAELSAEQITALLSLARLVKHDMASFNGALAQKSLVMLQSCAKTIKSLLPELKKL